MAKGWGETPCPEPLRGCKYDPPFADDHHLLWPAPDYRRPIEQAYRQLECNIVRGMCRCLHDLEHLKEPPEKPSIEVMKEAIANERASRG